MTYGTNQSSDAEYNIQQAIKAQDMYCKTNKLPHFAPLDGTCFYCGRNIFDSGGLTIAEAGNKLITNCPWCKHSYCE